MNVVEIQDLEFSYGPSLQPTLKIPKFQIGKSERVFLFGSSGCGKTTFLEILSGVLTAKKGQVRVLGQSLTDMSPSQKDRFRAAHLGYVFQSFNLIPYLSVFENIILPLTLSPVRQERLLNGSVETEVGRLCEHLGISELRTRRVTELSVGQQQRVAVARALLGSPELILADEPTSSLDSDHREKFIQLLFQVCEERGTTVLFVSHDRSLEKLFDRAVAFHDINTVGRP